MPPSELNSGYGCRHAEKTWAKYFLWCQNATWLFKQIRVHADCFCAFSNEMAGICSAFFGAMLHYCYHLGIYLYVWQHLPLQLKLVLLLDFVQLFSHVDKLFSNLPFELYELLDLCCCCCWCGHTTVVFDDDDGVAFGVGVVAVAVATVVQTSIGFVDSSSFNGSPFRLTTVISTSTPCNFDATDCNIAHKIQSIIDY